MKSLGYFFDNENQEGVKYKYNPDGIVRIVKLSIKTVGWRVLLS
jgi:hypothetical protein